MLDTQTIRRCPRFAGISEPAILWLAQNMIRRRYTKKQNLFFEGDPCNQLMVIEYGSVKVFKTLESGRELILNFFGAGESIGEVALIDRENFPASAITQEETSLLELRADLYFKMGELFPDILFFTIRDLTQRVRAMTQRIHELGSGTVEARLAQLFLSLAKAGKIDADGILIPLVISRQELADMVGVRIETVIRTMSKWHKQNIVQSIDKGFRVPTRKLLEKIIQH